MDNPNQFVLGCNELTEGKEGYFSFELERFGMDSSLYNSDKIIVCCTGIAEFISIDQNPFIYIPLKENYFNSQQDIGWLFHLKFYIDYLC